MGSVLLGAGTKGKRSSLRHSPERSGKDLCLRIPPEGGTTNGICKKSLVAGLRLATNDTVAPPRKGGAMERGDFSVVDLIEDPGLPSNCKDL